MVHLGILLGLKCPWLVCEVKLNAELQQIDIHVMRQLKCQSGSQHLEVGLERRSNGVVGDEQKVRVRMDRGM